jgi:hypothetical protein
VSWIHAVIDVPPDRHTATADFWGRVLGWPPGSSWEGHAELSSFAPPRGTAYLHLQRIEGPPRIHLDVESNTPEDTVGQAVVLGAELVAERASWRTLRSPGGLPFCVISAKRHRPPGPVTFPDGHRARMVQVCIDSPSSVHAAEVAFWRAFLSGRWAPSDAPEFAGKWHDDDGSPIQLLFQQLEETDGAVRAHLDVGTDDVVAEVRRLVDLGATDVGPGRGGWHVLRDAADQLFCATSNSPEQTQYRDIG